MATVQDDGFTVLCRALDLWWDEDEQSVSESARSDDQGKDAPDTDEGLSQNFIMVSGTKDDGYHSGSSREGGGDAAKGEDMDNGLSPFASDAVSGEPWDHELPENTQDNETSAEVLPENRSYPHEHSHEGRGEEQEKELPPSALSFTGKDLQDHGPPENIQDNETSAEALPEDRNCPPEHSYEGRGHAVGDDKETESPPSVPGFTDGGLQVHEPSENIRGSETSAAALLEGHNCLHEPSLEGGGDVASEGGDKDEKSLRDGGGDVAGGGGKDEELLHGGGGDVASKEDQDEESSPSALGSAGADLGGSKPSGDIRDNKVSEEKNKYLDQLMTIVGLEEVKAHFLVVKARVDAARRRGEGLKKERFDLVLLGNFGTGKKTIAKLYSKFLASMGVIPMESSKGDDKEPRELFFQISGYHFEANNINSTLNRFCRKGGGVIFINRAHELRTDYYILGTFLDAIEKYAGKNIVFIVAGRPEKGAETIRVLAENPGARFYFRRTITLKDYTDDELLRILVRKMKKQSMEAEGGLGSVYLRILIRRIGRSRGTSGFGNVHSLDREYSKCCDRQAQRRRLERLERPGSEKSDEFFLTKADLIGPEPSDNRHESLAWKQLQSMVGLEDVKEAVNELFGQAKANYHRELQGEEPIQMTMNRVFLGPPGTGKTTVGTLYGQILADLGLVSKRDVVTKNPSDFIGPYIGQSEERTNGILDATQGKVLIIDDAHMLYNANPNGNDTDEFRLAVVDTLVARIPNRPGGDRCIILIGYPELMREMFQNSNPGLQRRFPLEDAFQFQDYDTTQLSQILDLKLTEYKLGATEEAKRVATEVLGKARDRPNFGNGGEVENLLGRAQTTHRERTSTSPTEASIGTEGIVLEPSDFDPDYDRGSHASKNCPLLFTGLVGFEKIIKQFQGYQQVAAGMRLHGIDPRPHIPFTFVFKGPPGTGKTTTARIVGRIFYDMGFLSTDEVIECSASDLVSGCIGRTGPKVINLLERALGKVLFVDEAYRLGDGHYAGSVNKEAIGELVDCMEKPRYARKMVIVLAGYSEDMESLLSINRGLQGRFPTDVIFPYMEPPHCLHLLERIVGKFGFNIDYEGTAGSTNKVEVLRLFTELITTKSWANGRDVETLARTIVGNAFKDQGSNNDAVRSLSISTDDLIESLQVILRKRLRGGRRGCELEDGSF